MFKQTLKTLALSTLLIQGLAAESTEHTFPDGASLTYSLPEGNSSLSKSPIMVEELKINFPYFSDEAKLVGKAALSQEGTKYLISLNPDDDSSAYFDLIPASEGTATLKNTQKGSLKVEIDEGGESVHGTNIVLSHMMTTLKAEELDYTHEFKKVDGKDEIFSNKVKLLLKNGESIHNIDTKDPFALQEIINNPFSQFKETILEFSYLAPKNTDESAKDINATFVARGHKGFNLESSFKSENPFAKTPGAEKFDGFIFTLSAPKIDLRIEDENDKKQLKDALVYNVNLYESLLEQHPNAVTEKILESLRKNSAEIIERNYKYLTEFSKDDIGSFLLTVKGASRTPDLPEGKIAVLGAVDLVIRKFNLNLDLEMDTNGAYNGILALPEPETSIKELSRFIRMNAYLVEPIVRDLGYWEPIQNASDPEKMLGLLRQLSDKPDATGDAPLRITVKVDENGMSVGTLSMDRAAQLVVGWALMAFPIPLK